MRTKPGPDAFHAADQHLFATGITMALEAAYAADKVVPLAAVEAVIGAARALLGECDSIRFASVRMDALGGTAATQRLLAKLEGLRTHLNEFDCDDTWHGDPDQAARRCPTCDGTRPRNPEDAVTA